MQLIPPPGLVTANEPVGSAPRAAIVLALLAPLFLYFGTLESIVTIWNHSGTFAHGWVVAPISLWLAWRKRDELRALPLRPCLPAFGLVALAGLGWLVATLGDVQVLRHYALAAMFPLAVLAVCGIRIAAALAFPLLFLMFAVPFGEVLVPPLIQFTANFTVGALQLSGMPVLRNGTHFEIPSGQWSVVEACSGLRYLISSITLGCLYAYLSYRSWRRRAAFIALSIVVPIVANGLRAYMIVMIGHYSSMRLAVGVDHIINGWLFFGLVMFLMFWIGRLWQEDDTVPDPAPAAARAIPTASARRAASTAVVGSAAAFVALAALWPALAAVNGRMSAQAQTPPLAQLALPWQPAAPFTDWQPDFLKPDARLDRTVAAGDARVALSILYYRNNGSGEPLISSVNRLASGNGRYFELGTEGRQETVAGHSLALRETTISGPGGNLLAWHWIQVGGERTASAHVGKALQARERLMLRAGDGATVIAATPLAHGHDAARAALRAFLEMNLAPIDAVLGSAEKH